LDLGESAIRKLIACSWLLGTAALASAAAPNLFETLRWTEAGKEVAALSVQPKTCLSFEPIDEEIVRAGQALFNTPTLLGGQAAKAGLNCASCHNNGRDNPHFRLNGVSDRSGTADVSSSFFSAARGNGKFDPIIIPDLAAAGKISRSAETNEMEIFIRALIVDEFSGAEPTKANLEALSAYVLAIKACPDGTNQMEAQSLDTQLELIDAAIIGATEMNRRNDRQSRMILISAIRHQLGLISERYASAELKDERALLLNASRKLQAVERQSGSKEKFRTAFFQWQFDVSKKLIPRLRQKEQRSLYNVDLLSGSLNPR
jgi:hypothetical protein